MMVAMFVLRNGGDVFAPSHFESPAVAEWK